MNDKISVAKKLEKIKGVLFDVDGTLMNVDERFYFHYSERLRAIGVEPLERDVYEDMRTRGILSTVIPDVEDTRAQFWLGFLEDFSHSTHLELGHPYPGTFETLQWLQRMGYRMGVITGRTSNPTRVIEELSAHGLNRYFEFVLTNDDGKRGMNKAENLRKAASLIGATPSECVYVGDWQGDVESAKEAGIGIVIAVLTGGEGRQSLEKFGPDAILGSIAEIPGFLKALGPGL